MEGKMNKLREKMMNGIPTIGSFFEMGSSITAQCMALAGLDYFILDCEHGPYDPLSAVNLFRSGMLYGTTPLARVEAITRPGIMKPLDSGAQGLIIPCIKTVDDVKRVVEYGKYVPIGSRGVAANAANGYWSEGFGEGGMDAWFKATNDDILLIPQCETVECLNDLEDIVTVPGIDGLFIGPYDLSTSMGMAGQFDNPKFLAALDRILKICKETNTKTMIYAKTVEESRAFLKAGYDSVTYTMDTIVFTEAFKKIVSSVME